METNRFRVGTFNLYNLALPEERFYNRQYSRQIYRRKIRWIGDQLAKIKGDIVGFQEIFSQEAVQEALNTSGVYRNGVELLVGDRAGHGPVVGLATRFDVQGYESITEFPEKAKLEIDGMAVPITTFSRPVLRVRLQIRPALTVVVFVVHLKSKNPMIPDGFDRHDPLERAIGKARSLIRRAAEATAIRCLLIDYLRGNNDAVIIMGDINDTGHAVTSELMAGSPPWRKIPFEKKLRAWDILLYNVKDIQARQSYRDVYYTHIHNGHYESLDHILVSQEFVRLNPNHIGFVEYVQTFNDHLIDNTLSDDDIPDWQSDHGQVVATVRLRS